MRKNIGLWFSALSLSLGSLAIIILILALLGPALYTSCIMSCDVPNLDPEQIPTAEFLLEYPSKEIFSENVPEAHFWVLSNGIINRDVICITINPFEDAFYPLVKVNGLIVRLLPHFSGVRAGQDELALKNYCSDENLLLDDGLYIVEYSYPFPFIIKAEAVYRGTVRIAETEEAK